MKFVGRLAVGHATHVLSTRLVPSKIVVPDEHIGVLHALHDFWESQKPETQAKFVQLVGSLIEVPGPVKTEWGIIFVQALHEGISETYNGIERRQAALM